MNIWRVLCVTGLRGQEVANKVLPGLGYLVAFMVVLGGLVFNIGNVGGGAWALIPFWEFRPRWDMYLPEYGNPGISFQNAKGAMDTLTKVLGAITDRGYFYCDRSCKAAGRFSH